MEKRESEQICQNRFAQKKDMFQFYSCSLYISTYFCFIEKNDGSCFGTFLTVFFTALLLKVVWDRICFTEKMMATLVESSGLLFLQHHYSKRTSDLALLSAQRKLNLFQNSKQQKILK